MADDQRYDREKKNEEPNDELMKLWQAVTIAGAVAAVAEGK